MAIENYITIPELAKLLGVSRIAIYNRVKKGHIPATKIGRTYVIADRTVETILGRKVTSEGRKRIDGAVDRVVREYGEVLTLLGKD